MNTARDLAIVALEPGRSVEQGDLSLALAGAEVLDLVEAGALTLDDDRLVPGPTSATGDRLLDEAAGSLVRKEPYESVEDWLWRRGSELSSAYADDLEKIGLTIRRRGPRFPLRSGQTVPVESPARSRAEQRRASGEPVLTALAAAVGIEDEAQSPENLTDDTVTTVLAAVGDAVMELEAVRQRRSIEDSAFANVWRGF